MNEPLWGIFPFVPNRQHCRKPRKHESKRGSSSVQECCQNIECIFRCLTQFKSWMGKTIQGGRRKARRRRERACVYDNVSVSTIPSVWGGKKGNELDISGAEEIETSAAAQASCDAAQRAEASRGAMSFVYTGALSKLKVTRW